MITDRVAALTKSSEKFTWEICRNIQTIHFPSGFEITAQSLYRLVV